MVGAEEAKLEGLVDSGEGLALAHVGPVCALGLLDASQHGNLVLEGHLVGVEDHALPALVELDALVRARHEHHGLGVEPPDARSRQRYGEGAPALGGLDQQLVVLHLEAARAGEQRIEAGGEGQGGDDPDLLACKGLEALHGACEQGLVRAGRHGSGAGRILLAGDGPQARAVILALEDDVEMGKRRSAGHGSLSEGASSNIAERLAENKAGHGCVTHALLRA